MGSAIRRALGLAASLGGVEQLLSGLDGTLAFPTEAMRIARGHTNGPRPVRLPSGWLDGADDLAAPVGGDLLVSGG